MKVQFISDLHGYFDEIELKKSDILCITGDVFEENSEREVLKFMSWIEYYALRYVENVIMIPGNHDTILQSVYYRQLISTTNSFKLLSLRSKPYELMGLTFSAFEYCDLQNWAFYRDYQDISNLVNDIKKCDILLTHIPRFSVLDKNNHGILLGNNDLALKISELKPLIHAHGHIHESYGIKKGVDTLTINSSLAGAYGNGLVRNRESIVVSINPVIKIINYEESDLPNCYEL